MLTLKANGKEHKVLEYGDAHPAPNLYTGTKDFTGSAWLELSSWTKSPSSFHGLTVMRRQGAWQGLSQMVDAQAGEVYVFTALVKADAGSEYQFVAVKGEGSATFEAAGEGVPVSYTAGQWQVVRRIVKILTDGKIRPRIEARTDSSAIEICAIHLSKCSEISYWCE